jgi:hypothetical protein
MGKIYGKITIGVGSNEQREIGIIDFVQATFKDNRLITILTLENNEGHLLSIENPTSTGRNPIQNMWLSKESFLGLISTAFIYWNGKNEDLEKLMQESVENNVVNYKLSENLQDINDAGR